MKKLKLITAIAFMATLTSCVNGDDYGAPDESCITINKTKEVLEVTNMATFTAAPYTTDENLTDYIEAYVTSSDEGGNIYKSIKNLNYMTEQFHTLKFNSMSGAPAAGLLKDLPLRAVIKLDNGKYLTCQDFHFITRLDFVKLYRARIQLKYV